jgi:cobyrinic acid a,c-diamide synthase
MVHGYQTFDRNLNLVGVILNGIGSKSHLRICREAIEHYTGLPVLGYLPDDKRLAIPERHLGLVTTVENPETREFLRELTAQIVANFNLTKIVELAQIGDIPLKTSGLFPEVSKTPEVRIGVARDQAFSFYYQDNLDLLEAWGAELVAFSPINDPCLSDNLSGLYIGGGFPELYATDLANNQTMKQQIKSCAESGMPVYAECGGLMYMGTCIRDFESRSFEMVGAIESASRIDSHRLSLGYRTVKALADGPLMRQGEIIRGHEFHWSVLDRPTLEQNAYSVMEKSGQKEGFQNGSLLASYIHLHFAGLISLAPRFIQNCRNYRDSVKH